MPHALRLSPLTALLFSFATATSAGEWPAVRQALQATCIDCHNDKKAKGGISLEHQLRQPDVEGEFDVWEKIVQVIEAGEMPPEDADPLLPAEKKTIVSWVEGSLHAVATRNAGDPGPVTLRRLTHVEYQNTLQQLTRIHQPWTNEFTPDGGGGEGFTNIGDTLFLNPQQLDKYLSTARHLAEHATILPGTGVQFHAQKIGLRSLQQIKQQVEQGLYVWYQKAATPFIPADEDDQREADYMLAAWKWKHRDLTGVQSLEQIAKDHQLNLPFLQNWFTLLHESTHASRFLDLTRTPWRELPGPDPAKPTEIPPIVTQTVARLQAERRSWLGHPNPEHGAQRRQQDADGLRAYNLSVRPQPDQTSVHLIAGDTGDGNQGDLIEFTNFTLKLPGKDKPQSLNYLNWLKNEKERLNMALAPPPTGAVSDPSKEKPAPQETTQALTPEEKKPLETRLAAIQTTLDRFGKHPTGKAIEPNVLTLHAPVAVPLPIPSGTQELTASGKLDLTQPDAEHATAQWLLTAGNPPPANQIIPGVLTVWKRQTAAAQKTYADFHQMKTAFPDTWERRLEQVASNYKRNGTAAQSVYYLSEAQLKTLIPPHEAAYLDQMQADWRQVSIGKPNDQQQKDHHQKVSAHLHSFASQAWRRPLTNPEKENLSRLYDHHIKEGLLSEPAAREVVVSILISPHFLYKAETLSADLAASPADAAPAKTEMPLDAWQLASRISYLLWASSPDHALRQAAADGSLLKPKVRQQHLQRMLKDPKASALAANFAAQWLHIADFTTKTQMDSEKFPEFTAELRAAFMTETQLFLENIFRQDRPLTDIILADYTYLNETLARHYQIPDVVGPEFRQVSLKNQPRGGILAQGTVLAKTSRPHRTSPVLRGDWLLTTILDTPVPPPPNAVPELVEHPEKPASLRAQLEQHRLDAACASCHNRIDPLGFALEQFDPLGRLRQQDDLNQPLDTSASLTDGTTFDGFLGLRDYLRTRQPQFTRLVTRKLLAYALGRAILPTDSPLIDSLQLQLSESQNRPSTLITGIIESRQFLNRRID